MLKLGPQDDMYTDEDKQLRACIYIYTHLPVYLPVCLFIYLRTYLPICLSISVYPSIYLSIYAVAHVYMYTLCLRIVFQQVFAAVLGFVGTIFCLRDERLYWEARQALQKASLSEDRVLQRPN